MSCCIRSTCFRKFFFHKTLSESYYHRMYFTNISETVCITFSGFHMIEIGFVKTADNLFSISVRFQFLSILSISVRKSRLKLKKNWLVNDFSFKAYIAKFSKDNGVTVLTSKKIIDILGSQISYFRWPLKVKTTPGARKSPRKKIVKKNWLCS